MFLCGDVDLNPDCMRKETQVGGPGVLHLTERVSYVLKVAFRRLGHEVKVWITTDHPTRAYSDAGDFLELAEIKNIVNMVFATFFECKYEVDTTIEFLEKNDLIPPSDESIEYWKDKER